jgi:hypothetical protein
MTQLGVGYVTDDATISGKKLCEVFTYVFPLKKQCIVSPSKYVFDPLVTEATPLSSLPPLTHTASPPICTTTPIPSSVLVITILDDPPVTQNSTLILEELPNQQHSLPVDVLFMTPSSPTHTHFDTTFPESTTPLLHLSEPSFHSYPLFPRFHIAKSP